MQYARPQFQSYRVETLHTASTHKDAGFRLFEAGLRGLRGLRGRQLICTIWGVKNHRRKRFWGSSGGLVSSRRRRRIAITIILFFWKFPCSAKLRHWFQRFHRNSQPFKIHNIALSGLSSHSQLTRNSRNCLFWKDNAESTRKWIWRIINIRAATWLPLFVLNIICSITDSKNR